MEIKLIKILSLKIQELIPLPLKTLITNTALAGGKLMWIDGMTISFAGFGTTDKIIHDQIDGNFVWFLLEYADMPDYQPIVKDENLNLQVAVYNMSFSPFYQDVAKFIKSQKHK